MRWAIMVLVACLTAGRADADSPAIPPAYVVAAEHNGIPPAMLYAVASTESKVSLGNGIRPWPWTLNVAGKALRFGDRASACRALRNALEHTRIVDVGIAQLNVRWHPQLFGVGGRFGDPCAGLDPYANLDEAAALIRRHFEDSGDWLIAAGRYHRPAGGRPAARYREAVRQELLRLGRSLEQVSLTSTSGHGDSALTQQADHQPNLTWITPSPRPVQNDFVWTTPSPRRWLAEVASR
ncbi:MULTISPECIES: lytic transglycosylase domain-containing protein [unclassified Modicisalibacter]|uniref:lytic transglycosylase domain-containing protein n=1 Tax=unclassified Modicisalibacter TaxID=2679913 RepID=UPI001CC90C1A|nr:MULTISPECIES: lytic transglycosylase domain-containing protein [unclassified Modicisalibacter]MBZ9559053.1 lytic transglycosylase domain-containing protein [Modicisalibacter sp. R2A 31.J]MBZ9576836.1 lytic transglycosylase domain-containing protein [Modicisalibacter sp. MOD 31.J]